jgi:hypothetical protein
LNTGGVHSDHLLIAVITVGFPFVFGHYAAHIKTVIRVKGIDACPANISISTGAESQHKEIKKDDENFIVFSSRFHVKSHLLRPNIQSYNSKIQIQQYL